MFANENTFKKLLNVGFRLEGIAEQNPRLPEIKICEAESLENGLEAVAYETAKNMKARNIQEPAYHWCSWYYYRHIGF